VVCSGEAGVRPRGRRHIRDRIQEPHWTSVIFRGSSCAVTGCRWCGISSCRWASPRGHASCLDGLSAATKPTRRRSPPPKIGTSGSSRDQGTISPMSPRRKPDYCLNLGITWPGLVSLEIKDRVPTLSFKSFGAFTRRRRRTSRIGGRYRGKRATELDQRLRKGERSRPSHFARPQPGRDEELQRPALCSVCRRECLSGDLAYRWDGINGDAGWQAPLHFQGSLRLHRRHQHDHDSRRSGTISS